MYFCKSIVPTIDLPCKKFGILDIEAGTKEEWSAAWEEIFLCMIFRAQGSELEGGKQAIGSSG